MLLKAEGATSSGLSARTAGTALAADDDADDDAQRDRGGESMCERESCSSCVECPNMKNLV